MEFSIRIILAEASVWWEAMKEKGTGNSLRGWGTMHQEYLAIQVDKQTETNAGIAIKDISVMEKCSGHLLICGRMQANGQEKEELHQYEPEIGYECLKDNRIIFSGQGVHQGNAFWITRKTSFCISIDDCLGDIDEIRLSIVFMRV